MAKIVLVADDDARLREMMKRILTDAGYAAWVAGTWIEIQDAIRHEPENNPTCYVMDMLGRAGEGQGKDAAKRIIERLRKPVIWTSAVEPAPKGALSVPKGARFGPRLLEAVRKLIGDP
jgi:DNA-binding NtrC family response regulator